MNSYFLDILFAQIFDGLKTGILVRVFFVKSRFIWFSHFLKAFTSVFCVESTILSFLEANGKAPNSWVTTTELFLLLFFVTSISFARPPIVNKYILHV